MSEPSTTAAELIALAERVEGLTGPCRETDDEIAKALGHCVLWFRGFLGSTSTARPFTASLDAALGLVPEGWTYVSLEICARGTVHDYAHVRLEKLIGDDDEQRWDGDAKTLPLALTAAALRAMAQEIKP